MLKGSAPGIADQIKDYIEQLQIWSFASIALISNDERVQAQWETAKKAQKQINVRKSTKMV